MTTKLYEIYVCKKYSTSKCYTIEASNEFEAKEAVKEMALEDGFNIDEMEQLELDDIYLDVYSETIVDD